MGLLKSLMSFFVMLKNPVVYVEFSEYADDIAFYAILIILTTYLPVSKLYDSPSSTEDFSASWRDSAT